MIRNISYKDKELTADINKTVGKPYSLMQAFRLKGIGSPRLRIREASPNLKKYLPKIENGEFCNIEIRPGGIILRFRYHLDSMGWIIPFHHLILYKSEGYYSIHSEGDFLKVTPSNSNVSQDSFFEKLQRLKSEKQFNPL